MPKRTVEWNHAQAAWEYTTPVEENLLCEHSEPFLETWPTSGMMRNGRLSELPTLAPATGERGLSSSRSTKLLSTPLAVMAVKDSQIQGTKRRGKTGQISLTRQIVDVMGLDPTEARFLRTPTASEVSGGMSHPDDSKRNGQTIRLASQVVAQTAPEFLQPKK